MWGLKPNPSKNAVYLFHLNNRVANQEVTVNFCCHWIKHNKFPVSLGITFVRTLTYKHHLEKTASKLNRITWEAHTQVLRTSTLALLYSVADYCSPVWEGSSHCKLIDTELRKSLQINTGTVKFTKVQWLPVLANIEPPHIRRQNSVFQIAENPWGRNRNTKTQVSPPFSCETGIIKGW